jgi:predicted  nucleic acid-binding Zn-ribbon protein
MSLLKGLTTPQRYMFTLLVCVAAVLGYLLYDTTSDNIRGQKLLKEANEENLDLSQDIEIAKQKYDRLETELKALDKRVVKISYKKAPKKKRLYSAGNSSKKKSKYSKSKVNYKKLYFDLKKKCYGSSKSTKYKKSKSTNYRTPGKKTYKSPRVYNR